MKMIVKLIYDLKSSGLIAQVFLVLILGKREGENDLILWFLLQDGGRRAHLLRRRERFYRKMFW